jgi:hypothetical protein
MTTQIVEPPRSAAAARSTTNWEKWGWIYMRASGVLLVVLIFGHLFVNMVAGEGVKQIDFAFVAGKWANPFWLERHAHDRQRLRVEAGHPEDAPGRDPGRLRRADRPRAPRLLDLRPVPRRRRCRRPAVLLPGAVAPPPLLPVFPPSTERPL